MCINYTLVKIGLYALVTLNFHILLSFLSNFIEKFEPAEQDWNSSIKKGVGANLGISSPPSLSIHVRDPCTWPRVLALQRAVLRSTTTFATLWHTISSLASITVQLALCELPSYSFYLFFPGCQCSHYYIVRMHEQINELLSTNKKGRDCKCVIELYKLYDLFRVSSSELE